MPAGSERGSGSLLVVAVLLVVLTVAGVAMVIGGYLLATHRARADADLGALSGAAAATRGADACAAVRALPRSRHVQVVGCEQVGDQIDFVVTVEISVDAPLHLPGLPPRVRATGRAGPVDLATPGSDPLRS